MLYFWTSGEVIGTHWWLDSGVSETGRCLSDFKRLSSSWVAGEGIFLNTDVHTAAWLAGQTCGLPRSLLRQEKRGSMMGMNSVGSGKSFGASVSSSGK